MKVSILKNNRYVLSFLKESLIGKSFSFLLLLLSCAQTNGDSNNNIKPNDIAAEEEKINENYQAALQQQMSGLREMGNKNQELKEKQQEKEVKEWIHGTWESSGWDEWIGRYTSYFCIEENTLRFGYNGQDIYNGPYEINMETHQIIFDKHNRYCTQIGFNPRTRRLEDVAGVFRKVSNSVSYGSINSYSNGPRGGNSVAEQLEELDNEEAKIISIVDPVRRSGQFYPDILTNVMRMKQINDERLRLARRNGDPNLVQYYESKKMRSEAVIRGWGFN